MGMAVEMNSPIRSGRNRTPWMGSGRMAWSMVLKGPRGSAEPGEFPSLHLGLVSKSDSYSFCPMLRPESLLNKAPGGLFPPFSVTTV